MQKAIIPARSMALSAPSPSDAEIMFVLVVESLKGSAPAFILFARELASFQVKLPVMRQFPSLIGSFTFGAQPAIPATDPAAAAVAMAMAVFLTNCRLEMSMLISVTLPFVRIPSLEPAALLIALSFVRLFLFGQRDDANRHVWLADGASLDA